MGGGSWIALGEKEGAVGFHNGAVDPVFPVEVDMEGVDWEETSVNVESGECDDEIVGETLV